LTFLRNAEFQNRFLWNTWIPKIRQKTTQSPKTLSKFCRENPSSSEMESDDFGVPNTQSLLCQNLQSNSPSSPQNFFSLRN
jgi:hypothetical protein